jgi:hypothetical protein
VSERFHIHISARSFVSLTVYFALLLVLIVGSVSSSSSSSISAFSLAHPSPLLNTAFAVDMNEAPATKEATTVAR